MSGEVPLVQRVVFLAGASGDPDSWRPVGERLPASWDQRVYGLGQGQLGSDVVAGFKNLVRRRFAGDPRAESALAAVEWNPADPGARQLLSQALAYYASNDPDFRRGLSEVVSYLEYHVDQSHNASWRVGGDNYGYINTPVTDNRIYQSGEYVAGRDVLVDQSRVQVDLDQMAPIRNGTGIPKVVMVIGLLVALAGFAVLLSGMYDFFMFITSAAGMSSPGPGPPPELQPIIQRWMIGFGIFFIGTVLTGIGGVFRPKKR